MNLITISTTSLTDILDRCILKPRYRAGFAISEYYTREAAEEIDAEILDYCKPYIGKATEVTNSTRYEFLNGSTFEIFLPSKCGCRGKRIHELHIDPRIDNEIIYSVLLPMQCVKYHSPQELRELREI